MMLWILPLVLALLVPVFGQQYEGAPVQNSLPTTPGSTITWFNVKDEAGGNATLINYFSLPLSTGKKQDPSKVQRAIVVLHGQNRDPATYFSVVWAAIGDAARIDPTVTEETVSIFAMQPYFPNGEDKNYAYPWVDGQPAGQGSTSKALVWTGSHWADGERNQYPHEQNTISSYDVLDQILQYFDNKTIYPNLHQIIIVGHSLGGRTVHHYAAVGRELGLRTPVRYWVGNPNAFLWLDSSRPKDTSSCPTFDDWENGLSGYTNRYERDFVQNGRTNGGVLARYKKRSIIYARGLNDFGDDSSSCEPATTGANRGERFLNFLKAFPPDAGDNVDYNDGIGHNAPAMFTSQAGLYRLFLDNFNGNGSRRADFGTRQVSGDNPHPVDTAKFQFNP